MKNYSQKAEVLGMRIRWLLLSIMLSFNTGALAFSITAVTNIHSPWLEVKLAAEKQSVAFPAVPTLNNALLKKWLAKVRAKPHRVSALDLDLIRQDWSEGVDVNALRRILSRAYIAAPQLRASLASNRLEAFLFLQTGNVKSARGSLDVLITWCKKPNSGGDGFDAYEHCSPMLLAWIANGTFTLDLDSLPERVDLQEQTFDCTNGGFEVSDLLEFDLFLDPKSADAVARLGMRHIWNSLLKGCSLEYSAAALKPLAARYAALISAEKKASQRLNHEASRDFEFLHDRLPWPKKECDYTRSPDCSLHRDFSVLHKRYVLRRIIALANYLSPKAEQARLNVQIAKRLVVTARAQLLQRHISAGRSSLAEALRLNWTPETDFAIRLIDALLQGAAAPPNVNPRPKKGAWTYSACWFDERAFETNRLIYETLLPPSEFRKLLQMQAWERVLAQASYLVNEKSTTEPAGASMVLHGSWHGEYLKVEQLQLPWPTEFDFILASFAKPLPKKERLAIFARMQVTVLE